MNTIAKNEAQSNLIAKIVTYIKSVDGCPHGPVKITRFGNKTCWQL